MSAPVDPELLLGFVESAPPLLTGMNVIFAGTTVTTIVVAFELLVSVLGLVELAPPVAGICVSLAVACDVEASAQQAMSSNLVVDTMCMLAGMDVAVRPELASAN